MPGARARGGRIDQRPPHLALQPRPPSRLRRHQHLHEVSLLRGCAEGRRLRSGFRRHPFRHRHHLSSRHPLRHAGGAAHLGGLRRVFGRRRGRSLRRAGSLRRGRCLRHPRQHREDLRSGLEGGLARLHLWRLPDPVRRRPQPGLPQRPRHRAPHRRQRGHHSHRPPHRHAGHGHGRADAHHALVLDYTRPRKRRCAQLPSRSQPRARRGPRQLPLEEPGADGNRGLVRLASGVGGGARARVERADDD